MPQQQSPSFSLTLQERLQQKKASKKGNVSDLAIQATLAGATHTARGLFYRSNPLLGGIMMVPLGIVKTNLLYLVW